MISSSRRGVEEAPRTVSRAPSIGLGRGVGEVVQAAVDVGVFVLIGVRPSRSITAPRLLRRGGVVEIDQRLAVDLSATGSGNRRGSPRRRRARADRGRRGCLVGLQPLGRSPVHGGVSRRSACGLAAPALHLRAASLDCVVSMPRGPSRSRRARAPRRRRPAASAPRPRGFGRPRGAQVEEQVVVERAAGRAMARTARRRRRSRAPACCSWSAPSASSSAWLIMRPSVFCACGAR